MTPEQETMFEALCNIPVVKGMTCSVLPSDADEAFIIKDKKAYQLYNAAPDFSQDVFKRNPWTYCEHSSPDDPLFHFFNNGWLSFIDPNRGYRRHFGLWIEVTDDFESVSPQGEPVEGDWLVSQIEYVAYSAIRKHYKEQYSVAFTMPPDGIDTQVYLPIESSGPGPLVGRVDIASGLWFTVEKGKPETSRPFEFYFKCHDGQKRRWYTVYRHCDPSFTKIDLDEVKTTHSQTRLSNTERLIQTVKDCFGEKAYEKFVIRWSPEREYEHLLNGVQTLLNVFNRG